VVNKRRGKGRRDWPSHLHERAGYFSWRHPVTRKEYDLGRDKREAFRQAIEANALLAAQRGRRSLADRISGIEDTTVGAWADRYLEIVAARDVTAETIKTTRRRIEQLRGRWGSMNIGAVTTRDVADVIRDYEAEGKARTATAMRSLMLDFFREAQAAGWLEANPVAPTNTPRVQVGRDRLTLEQFLAIYEIAQQDDRPWWLPRAMELALLTGQRREDVRAMGPQAVRDGYLWVEQQKTGNRVAIPTGLHLTAVGWSLAEVIERCRSRHILTRHLLHHRAHAGQAKPGHPIRRQTISAGFASARDDAGLTWRDGKTPATFHEIRSLSARLFADERGHEFAQALLGHKTASMAALYRDSRGAEWVKVPG